MSELYEATKGEETAILHFSISCFKESLLMAMWFPVYLYYNFKPPPML